MSSRQNFITASCTVNMGKNGDKVPVEKPVKEKQKSVKKVPSKSGPDKAPPKGAPKAKPIPKKSAAAAAPPAAPPAPDRSVASITHSNQVFEVPGVVSFVTGGGAAEASVEMLKFTAAIGGVDPLTSFPLPYIRLGDKQAAAAWINSETADANVTMFKVNSEDEQVRLAYDMVSRSVLLTVLPDLSYVGGEAVEIDIAQSEKMMLLPPLHCVMAVFFDVGEVPHDEIKDFAITRLHFVVAVREKDNTITNNIYKNRGFMVITCRNDKVRWFGSVFHFVSQKSFHFDHPLPWWRGMWSIGWCKWKLFWHS